MAANRRGKQSSRNKPSKGTKADQRLKGRGKRPGPKVGSKNKRKR